jgi:hypothetical protein
VYNFYFKDANIVYQISKNLGIMGVTIHSEATKAIKVLADSRGKIINSMIEISLGLTNST